MTTLAIDPGVAGGGCAVALFESARLTMVCFEVDLDSAELPPLDSVVVERPEYQGARSDKARVKDLIDLAWEGAMLAGSIAGDQCPVSELGVRAWKGSLPKPVTHAKLWAELNAGERAILGGRTTHAQIERALEKGASTRWKAGRAWYPKKFITHNLLDAAAIGCVHLGRLQLV